MLTATDLLSPVGPVDASLFPGEASNVLEARLDQYLQNGYSDERVDAQTDATRKDNLARVYALYQTFNAVYIRMNASPTTLAVTEKGSHTYSYEQIRGMKQMADKYLSDFNALLVVSPDTPSSQLPGTRSAPVTVVW